MAGSGMNAWNKFLLLMWKNWILEKHHKIQFIFEITLPTIFVSLLVLTRNLSQSEEITTPTIYNPEILDNNIFTLKKISDISLIFGLAYSPQNRFIDSLVYETAKHLNVSAIGFQNSTSLEEYLKDNNMIAGIDFNDSCADLKEYPKHLTYALRFPSELREVNALTWQTNHLYQQFEGTRVGPRISIFPSYFNEGFTTIQHSIATAFIKLGLFYKKESQYPKFQLNNFQLENFQLPKMELQKFPYPPFTRDIMNTVIDSLLGTFIVMSFSFIFICTVKYITAEKEKQLKEFMKIMGLPNWLHWTSWFVKTFIVIEIANTFLILIMKFHKEDYPSLLHNSSWSAVYFFFTIYGISTITFSFMMSTFFSRSNTAATVSGLFWYLSYFPFYFLKDDYQSLSLCKKLASSLFSNSALGFGIKLIANYQAIGKGFQWNNMWVPVTTDDTLCIGYVILMMILDSILYMLIALYMEKVFPGEYGIPKPWYFPFTMKFWCKKPHQSDCRETPFEEQDTDAFEAHPLYKKIGIKIKGLQKEFDEKIAVKELFMNMYEGEITALLGHNGAGKSTTMSMLTGLIPPTSGTAIINGYDIRTDISEIRMSLGLCAQNDILFDDLTPKEHLIFYSRLKGIIGKNVEIDVNKYLRTLELEDKSNAPSMKLSGGMKRKLSVAISLCGDPKIILMDEPTAGMDPSARRSLWNLLQQEKHGRTILLSTHFMDEADVLGDRIAILCEGELKCYGSSFFLKKKFGTGYHLICVKAEGCNSKNVTDLLQRYIPKIKITSEIGKELSYELSDQYSGIFEQMLSELEVSSNKLGLSGYGISLTTLEEVFMRIGRNKQKEKLEENNGSTKMDEDLEAMTPCFDAIAHHGPLEKGFTLLRNCWKAMFYKKFIYTIRNWPIFSLQIIVPLIWIILILIGVYAYEDYLQLPPLPITLDKYSDATIILEVSKHVRKNTLGWSIADEYTKFLINETSKNFELISINKDFQDYFLEVATNDMLAIKFRYLIAASIGENKIIAWYNNEMLHTAPLSLNLIHNSVLRSKLGPQYRIDVINYPQADIPNTKELDEDSVFMMAFFLSLYIAFGMSFVTCFYVLLPIRERISGIKLLQFVAGISPQTYWFSVYVWDLITFIFISIVYLITVGLFQQIGFSTFEELGRIFMLLIFFGISGIPFTYLISKLLNDASTAFSRMWILNVLLGPVLFLIVYIVNTIQFNQTNLAWIFRIIPHYSLSEGLINLSEISSRRKICFHACKIHPPCNQEILCVANEKCCNLNFFSWTYPGIIPDLVYFIGTTILMMAIILTHDLGYMNELFNRIHNFIWRPVKPSNDDSTADDDVKAEKEKVKNLTMRDIVTYNIVLDRVIKFYRKILAVNEISVAINNSECFGLLGVNGAGKTTTFKMMTGEEIISSGQIYLKGNNTRNNINEIHQETGYCPQTDALLDDFTGRELLRIFCYIRGIPNSKTERLCIQLTKDLDFEKYLDKRIKSYSGGTKRKLSTAIALVGSPSIIFLDEPSAGMDPSARRQLWNIICRIRDAGRTIILTSHSMEECEALCTRLAIMVNGEFKCLGSTQHLKNKFSKGIVLKMKLKNRRDQPRLQSVPEEYPMLNADVENVLRFVGTNFWSATLSEHYDGMLTFHIPLANIRWSKIFGLLENNRELLNLEDYSISQTTLEQIFLDFANQQKSE